MPKRSTTKPKLKTAWETAPLVDASQKVRDDDLKDVCSSNPDISPVCGTRNQKNNKSCRIGLRLCIFAIGLTVGFGLGWFAGKYQYTAGYTVTDHCGIQSLTEEALTAEIYGEHNVAERVQTNDNLQKDKLDNVGENVNLKEGVKPKPEDGLKVDKELVYQNNDLDDQSKENIKEDENKEADHRQERQQLFTKTFTFKDGKIQEQGVKKKSSDEEKIPTEKRKNKESKQKDSNPNDGLSLQSAALSHTPAYLQGLDVGYSIRVGENIVSPKELTNGTGPVRVYIYENFLTPNECEGLMGAHNRHVMDTNKNDPLVCFDGISTLRKHLKAAKSKYKVSKMDFTKGTTCMNSTFSKKLKKILKWSYSTAFYPGESRFSTIFEQRVLEATGLRPENGGKLQITSYQEGIGYKTHTDCTIGSDDKRDRVATILVYLQDVYEGGETKFPELNLSVRPVKGRALVWNNMNPTGDCQPLSIHEATQVKEGHKYILQRWYYYENFYHLGKRPSEPSLPERIDGQPRVSCDEYENGSCRWYDEWNYDHIVDYQASKSNLV